MSKVIQYNNPWGGGIVPLQIYRGQYSADNSLALGLLLAEDVPEFGKKGEDFAMITVRLDKELRENYQYVDTNDMPDIEKLIKETGIGRPTFESRISGFCSYPLYEFDLDKISEYLYIEEEPAESEAAA